jgi:hypothetical protein
MVSLSGWQQATRASTEWRCKSLAQSVRCRSSLDQRELPDTYDRRLDRGFFIHGADLPGTPNLVSIQTAGGDLHLVLSVSGTPCDPTVLFACQKPRLVLQTIWVVGVC